MTFRFFDFPVYIQSKQLYKEILDCTRLLKNYSLKEQINRAALSVVLNIAEGSAKKSDKEFGRYIQNSLGSVSEVAACLDVLQDANYLQKALTDQPMLRYQSVAKQLGGLLKKLYSTPS